LRIDEGQLFFKVDRMRLHEYQSKSIFSHYGIPIPKGRIANTAGEAKQIAEELGGRVVIKAQVLIGGRGKAGGIRLAKSVEEAEELATHILSMDLKGLPVRRVLVDEIVSFNREIYLGITNDRMERKPIIIASGAGGVDIEEVAIENPEKIIKIHLDAPFGLHDFQTRNLAIGIDLPRELWKSFNQIAKGLWKAFKENDAAIAEINPLVITNQGMLMALDGKMVVDDNALFRHPELVEIRDLDAEEPAEVEARKYGLSFIKLEGNIGCMVNGAGLAMATLDLIKENGGSPSNFLDIGGGASSEKVSTAIRIICADPAVKVILINIFGGITRCDEVARGILSAINELQKEIPLVIRLAGTNAEKGLELLSESRIETASSLVEAARKAVELAGGESK
jgi:succinyl-CoA synthetase beta subunit